eukprot:533871-Hanusia_phi.AAC.1
MISGTAQTAAGGSNYSSLVAGHRGRFLPGPGPRRPAATVTQGPGLLYESSREVQRFSVSEHKETAILNPNSARGALPSQPTALPSRAARGSGGQRRAPRR